MVTVSLNSNLSHESIQLIPIYVTEETAEFELAINSRYWDGEHEYDAQITSESVVLSCQRLRELAHKIDVWLSSDLKGRLPFSGVFKLDDGTVCTELELTFASRSDMISADETPVVTVKYRIGRLIGEFSFVTDQSCLNLFVRNLTRSLNAIAG